MSYQSVISHQVRASFRAIRADYVAICKGAKDPVCAALLLDLAEAWTNHILDKKEDETLDGIEIDGDLWFYRSEEKIMGDLFNAYGINKLRDNRRWLVNNGLLECQQIPRTEGGFTNYYRLPIETVQAKIDALAPVKNNGRLAPKHPLKITDAPVKNNAIREIAKESKKEHIAATPRKKTDADLLATAFGVEAKTTRDFTMWGKLASDLKVSGVEASAYPEYIAWVRKTAKTEGNWNVTPHSLTSNARPATFLASKQSRPSTSLQAAADTIFSANTLATDGVVTFEKRAK